jgi:uncharacterized protein (DUF2147 family)
MQILASFGRNGNLVASAAVALGAAVLAMEVKPAQAQVPEVGVWINHEGKGAVEIKPCGDALCGNIVWLKSLVNDEGQPLIDRRNPDESKRNRPICGLAVIGNVRRTSDGWDEGWIYNPEEGAQYDVYLKASGDRLTVTGYKGVKLFSKTFTWTRAPADLQRCSGANQAKIKSPAKPATAPAVKATAPAAVVPQKSAKPAAGVPAPKPVARDNAKANVKAGAATAPTAKKPAASPSAKTPEQKATVAKKPAPAKAAATKSNVAATPAVKKPAATSSADKKAAVKPVAKKKTADEAEASSAME